MVCLVGLFCGLVNAVKSAALMVRVRFCRAGNLKITAMKLHRKYAGNIQKLFVLAAMAGLGISTAQAAIIYWDTASGSGNGVGGGTTWSGQGNNLWSTASTGDASLTSASTSDDGRFQGTAGTITFSFSPTLASWTFNTTGFVLTGNNTTTRTVTGPVSLASNVTLTIGNGETADRRIQTGSISGSSGAGLTINGAATGNNLTRFDVSTNGAAVAVPITVSGTGFVAISGDAGGSSTASVSGTVTGNGSRLNLGATSGTTMTFSNTINNGSGTVRISAGASGGAGIVILSGAGNTWGATELNNAASGIFRMGTVNALPTGTTLTFGAAAGNGDSIVELSGKSTEVGQLTNGAQSGGILRNTSATPATLTIIGSDTAAAAFSGVIQDGVGGGALSLIRSGNGSTTLSGTNTFTGGTSINGGTLKLGGSGSILPDAGAIELGGGILDLNGFDETVGAVTLNSGSIVNNGSGTKTLTASSFIVKSGTISTLIGGNGSATLTKNTDGSGSGGTVTLGTGNTFGGKTTINAGYIATSGESAFGTNPGSFTADQITLNGGGVKSTGTMEFNSNRGITLSASGGAFDSTGGTITLTNVVTGSGALTKAGSGTLILNNVHTYTGGTFVNAGTVQFGVGNIIPDTSAVTVAGGTLDLQSHDETVGAVTVSSGSIIGNGGTLTGSSFDIAVAGVVSFSNTDAIRTVANATITNAGAVTASGTGSNDGIDGQTNTGISVTNSGSIQGARHGITGGDNTLGLSAYTISVNNQAAGTLTGSNGSGINMDGVKNTYVATIINSGTITGAWDGVSGFGDGDGVDVDGVIDLTNSGTIRGLSSSGSGSLPEGLAFGGGTVVNNSTGVITGGAINGTGIEGHGILVDDSSGGNAITATTITNSGIIRGYTGYGIKMVGTFANTVTNNAGGTIQGAGTDAAIQSGDGNDIVNNSGAIIGGSGSAIDLQGGDDTLNITGGAASISGSINGSINGGSGTNALVISPGASNAFSYTGAISNFSTVTVQSGTVTLGGANTYTGNTVISGGVLLVSGSISGSAVTVQNAGTLGTSSDLTGGTTGSVTVQNGGTLSPGASTGLMTVAGNLAVASGGIFLVEINGTTAGTGYDQLSVTNGGSVDFSASPTLTLGGSYLTTPAVANDLFFILLNEDSDAINGTFSGLGEGSHVFASNGQDFIISYRADFTNTNAGNFGTAQGNDIALLAVPEPGSAAMLLGGLAMLLSKRRRRL
jgi:autotransporter-associated beta strand protein